MEQELLISLAETKSLLKEWCKESPKNQRWLTVLTAITKLQVNLASKGQDHLEIEVELEEDRDETLPKE